MPALDDIDNEDEGLSFGGLVDDSDDDVEDIVEAPRPPRRKPTPTPRRPASPAIAQRNSNVEDDLDAIFSELNVGAGECRVLIARTEPLIDKKSGKRIAGHLQTFSRPVSQDDIKDMFGGGRYLVTIQGPPPNGGSGMRIRARKAIEIAGEPVVQRDPHEEEKAKKNEIAELLEYNERERERVERQAAEARAEARELNKTIMQLLAKNDSASIAQIREEQRARDEQYRRERDEERRREEKRLEEERRREELRLERERLEREERWREEQRRREEEREERRREEQRRLEEDRARREEAKAQAEAQVRMLEMQQQRSTEMMSMFMQLLTSTNKEKESVAMSAMQSQLQMQQASTAQMIEILQSNKDDFFSSLEKFNAVRDFVSPPEQTSPFERGIEKVGEMVQGVLPGLAMLRQPGAAQQAQPRKRIAPGSLAVVEEVEDDEPPASPPQLAAPSPQPKQEDTPVSDANPITDFLTYEGAPNDEMLTRLVQNLDLAMQRGLDLEEMYAKCIATLPAPQKKMLRSAPLGMVQGIIEGNVPESWALRSLDAQDTIAALHAKLVADG